MLRKPNQLGKMKRNQKEYAAGGIIDFGVTGSSS
jgi:hypothetical protein